VEAAADPEPDQLVVPPVEVPAVETPAAGDESVTQATAQADLHVAPGPQPADGQD
jgi:aromatic-L-amino-acid/L-tryptophan decarboxylase